MIANEFRRLAPKRPGAVENLASVGSRMMSTERFAFPKSGKQDYVAISSSGG
jgi:hypothetical protein